MTKLYAAETTVPAERSRAEIETILKRYGASRFMSGYDENQAAIMFEAHDRRIRFTLPIPNIASFGHDGRGRRRTAKNQQAAYDQEVRRRWRALALAIKAKLEVVESGIASFEDEFMAHIVLPNGSTVGQWMAPQIDNAYINGNMPPLLPSGE